MILTIYLFYSAYSVRLDLNNALNRRRQDANADATQEAPKEGEQPKAEVETGGTDAQNGENNGEPKKIEAKVIETEIIDKAPFNITGPNQIIEYQGNTLSNPDDYTSYNKPAFFTMSIVSVGMFESKEGHQMQESINLGFISEEPYILLGSTKCLNFKDGLSKRNIVLCANTPEEANQLIEAFRAFMKLRNANWKPKDPLEGRIVRASCTGIKDPNDKTYDFLETQKIFKEKLLSFGVSVEESVIDPVALTRIKDTSERIKSESYVVPGSKLEFKNKYFDDPKPLEKPVS